MLIVAMGTMTSVSARDARADDRDESGSHGRLKGDVTIAPGVGVALGPRAPRLAGELRLRYVESIGIFGTYEDGASFGLDSEPKRVISVGTELRPLFWGRFLQGAEWGMARPDLTLDSLALELGAFFQQPGGAQLGDKPGFQFGLGLETPILEQARGPWIGVHAAMRLSDAALGGASIEGPADRAFVVSISLSWHELLRVGVVDMGDRRVR